MRTYTHIMKINNSSNNKVISINKVIFMIIIK